MNVGELKKALEQYPDDMEVIVTRYSDREIMTPDQLEVEDGVDQDGYVMWTHPTMSDDNKARVKSYLHIGN